MADIDPKAVANAKAMGDNIKEATKAAGLFEHEMSNISATMNEIVGRVKNIHLEKGYNVKHLIKMDAIQKKINKRTEVMKKLSKLKLPFNPKVIAHQVKKMKELNGEVEDFSYEMEAAGKTAGGAFDDLSDGANEVKGGFKALWSGNRKGARDAGKSAIEMAAKWKGLGEKLSLQKGLVGALGGAMKGLAPALGGVGKLIAGWPGAVLMAAKAVWDFGMNVDQAMKDINKAYANLRGPDITTSDVKNQFKEFNDMIYNTGENWRVGLNVEQIRGFMESVTSAGAHLDKLNQGVTDYRSSIYVAAKASKILGMELPRVGSVMSDMMLNLRMDMDQIDASFNQVAFSAKKAGISSDKFWGAVQNASVSLSLYGVFVGYASKQMEKFAKTGVIGIDEVATTVQDLTQGMDKMELSARASMLALVKGGLAAAKAKGEAVKKTLGGEEGVVKAQIELARKRGEPVPEELLDKLGEIGNRIAQASLLAKAQNEVEAAAYLPVISETMGEFLTSMVKNQLGVANLSDLTNEQIIVAQGIFKQAGQSDKLLMNMIGIGRNIQIKAKEQVKILQLGKKLTDDENAVLEEIASTNPEIKAEIDRLKQAGNVASDEEITKLQALMDTVGAGDILAFKSDKATKVIEDDLAKKAEDTFNELVNQTLSFKEMQDIAESELRYRFNSIRLFSSINEAVWKSANKGMKKEANPLEQKRAREVLKEAGIKGGTKEDVKAYAISLKTSEEEMAAIDKAIQDQTNIINSEVSEDEKYKAGAQKRALEDDKRKKQELINKNMDILGALGTLNESSQTMIDELLLQKLGDYKTVEKLSDQVNFLEKSGKNERQIIKELGLSTLQYDALQRQWKSTNAVFEQGREDLSKVGINLPTTTPSGTKKEETSINDKTWWQMLLGLPASKAGLAQPYTIPTSAMPLTLHKGETILPAGGGGGGGGRGISISVTGVLADLPQKIANEVRSVIYKEQQAGRLA